MFCGPTQTVCEIFYDVTMRGRHIYHLVWGILLLMLVGYCWLVASHLWFTVSLLH
jgi:hypothetical protein